jgi:hypothetical protein
MKRLTLASLALTACGLVACTPDAPPEHYGFIARLGRDTVSVESVARRGNKLTSDEVDRFPRVRQRHTEITLGPDGGIKHLVMDIRSPSEPENQRERHVVVDVTNDVVNITKRDASGVVERKQATGGITAMAHVPQMYSLYDLFFQAALDRAAKTSPAGDTVRLRQFYIDREFDKFSLHGGTVHKLAGNKAEIWHDWLAGIGEATLDSAHHLLRYSGARTTYQVDVERVTELPDVQTIGKQFAALEANTGAKQLSVRDTARATIGAAALSVDYGRPLMRGRELLGKVVPYDRVWRTGANAATQFTTLAPITVAGIRVPSGTYTLWTVPRASGTDLVINKQAGQWGTTYDSGRDLARARMTTEKTSAPVEKFTISIVPADEHHGTLMMEWGTFRWTAPIVVDAAASAK